MQTAEQNTENWTALSQIDINLCSFDKFEFCKIEQITVIQALCKIAICELCLVVVFLMQGHLFIIRAILDKNIQKKKHIILITWHS